MSLLTTQEAAERLRCCDRTIRRAIQRGEIKAMHFGGKWLIDESDLPTGVSPAPRKPPAPRQPLGRFAAIAREMDTAA